MTAPRPQDADGSPPQDVEVSALAINVTIPPELHWNDSRRGEAFTLTTLNVRLLPDGRMAAKAYGRPVAGGRGTYTSFPVPPERDLDALLAAAAAQAASRWSAAARVAAGAQESAGAQTSPDAAPGGDGGRPSADARQ